MVHWKTISRNVWIPILLPSLVIASAFSAGPSTGDTGPESSGPSSRVELWSQQRADKQNQVRPEKVKPAERFLIWIEEKGAAEETLNIHYRRLYPGGGISRPFSGLSLGARYWHADIQSTLLDVGASAVFSIHGYQQLGFQFGKVKDAGLQFELAPSAQEFVFLRGPRALPSQEKFFLFADLRHSRFNRENFFGLGRDSGRFDRSNFRLEETSFEGASGYQINSRLSVTFRGGLVRFDVGPGNDGSLADTTAAFTDGEAPGLDRQPDFLRLQGALVWDFRDKPGNPHRGGLLGISFSRLREVSAREFRFNRFTADSRYYLPLGSSQRLLAARFFTTVDRADKESRVPFYLQQTLGGGQALRGFREMRFRDENLIYLSAEYRWEAAVFLELAVFYDAGKVVSRRADYGLTGLEKSSGFGIRLKSPYSVFLRLEVSRGREGTRAYLRFGPSF